MINKICILSTPCSGKSTLIEKGVYPNLMDYDFMRKNKLVNDLGNIPNKNHLEFIESLPDSHILLSPPHTPYLYKCFYLSFILPKEEMEKYINKRLKEQVNKKWNSYKKIKPLIDEINYISNQYNIKKFNSLLECVEFANEILKKNNL